MESCVPNDSTFDLLPATEVPRPEIGGTELAGAWLVCGWEPKTKPPEGGEVVVDCAPKVKPEEADVPSTVKTVSYVLLIVLMFGVITGWLGGL